MTPILRTDRLILRPPVIADLDRLVEGISNYAVAKFLTPVPHPYSRADGLWWLNQVMSDRSDDCVFAIDLAGEGFIGSIGYESALGYWIAEPHWGRGLITEAARAVVGWKFEDSSISTLVCGAHIDNTASMHVQQKLGFTVTGTNRIFATARQTEVEHFRTVLDRPAFVAACAQLDARSGSQIR